MNELIRELALQAGFYVANDKIYTPLSREEITKYQAKFAELIVRECMYVGRLSQVSNGLVDLDIKEHFGVEE